MAKPVPISRELVRIIRDASLLGKEEAPLGEHLKSIEERQAQAIEFYLRSCSLRLGAARGMDRPAQPDGQKNSLDPA
jgi:hypothetical protein